MVSVMTRFWTEVTNFINYFNYKKGFIFGYNNLKDPTLISRILENIENSKIVIVMYFDLAKFHEVEQISGSPVATKVLAMFKKGLEQLMPVILPGIEILAVENLWGDDFVVIMVPESRPEGRELQRMAIASRIGLREKLKGEFLNITGHAPNIHVGYATIKQKTGNLESHLYMALREAQGVAKGAIDIETALLLSEFRDLLEQNRFETVYQPIVSLRSGGILGWEALTRGPQESYFRSPDIIFSFAEEAGLLYPLEKVCRQLAIRNVGDLGQEQKLFLNIHPRTICDPNFVKGETIKLISALGVRPSNIVFEITERHSIKDFSYFNRTLEHYRNQGFMIAIDDAGSGFSCLQSIAEIKPDYIKLDMSLIRNINKNAVKRCLIETFITFAEKIDCTIIAEGIETEEEMSTLTKIGVHYGQGYYLGRPKFPKANLEEVVEVQVLQWVSNGRSRGWKHPFPVGDITENSLSVEKTILVREVKKIIDDNELNGIVVVENGKPVGLVMRYHLDRYLGSQYGVPLYFDRPISVLMDNTPLVTEENSPIEIVSQAAMNREKLKLYDYIIVTKNQNLKGVVSVQMLLDTMTKIRLEMAKGSNPLTGLPGNIAIEQEILRRAREKDVFTVIYLDLDYFKTYNDKYGFENGDRVLLFIANLLNSVIKKYSSETDFIGHIGGDDFIIITSPEKSDIICNKVARYFDRLIRTFYTHEDRVSGKISGCDRCGNEARFPLMSISMAIIDCGGYYFLNDPKKISEKAAQLKKYAKSIPGSVYVKDRRAELQDNQGNHGNQC